MKSVKRVRVKLLVLIRKPLILNQGNSGKIRNLRTMYYNKREKKTIESILTSKLYRRHPIRPLMIVRPDFVPLHDHLSSKP